MRTSVMGVTVAGVLLVMGTATAQMTGPTLRPASRGVIPLTGRSTVSSLPEPANSQVTLAVAPGAAVSGEDARKSSAGGPPAETAARPAPRTAKVAHKPAAKPTVKKASAAKRVVKGVRPARTRHVATAKHQWPAHRPAVSKAIPVTKHQPPAKNAAPTPPVLPRV